MDKQLTTEPEKLKKFIDESTSIEQINEETIAAVVEACFRLALHPETSRNEAITYLKRAYKIDNVDPRFPYHIARLYFLGKDFEQTQKWLMKAYELCSTSHRIWLHIALLQNELNIEFNKDNSFKKGELKEKAGLINDAIINKKNFIEQTLLEFKPSLIKKDNEFRASTKKEEKKEEKHIEANGNNILNFIENKFKEHNDLLATILAVEPNDESFSIIEKAIAFLHNSGKEISQNINEALNSYCSLSGNSINIANVLDRYRLFYSYTDNLLRINICRRKAKDRLDYILKNLNIKKGKNGNSANVSTLYNQVSIIDIKLGKNNIGFIESAIDSCINTLKSVREVGSDKCRWLGVYDISIENILYDEASVNLLDKIKPLLEEIFQLIEKRPDGTSSIAVVATEWLISGYSPRTIREMVDAYKKDDNDEFIKFIELLCNLFECEVEKLPDLLARELNNNNITPLLASLINKKRYVWRQISYEKNFEFKRSVKLIQKVKNNASVEVDASEVNQNIKSLLDGLTAMWNPKKLPQVIEKKESKKTVIKAYSISEVEEFLVKIEEACRKFNGITDKLQVGFLKNFKPRYGNIASSDDYAYVMQQKEALSELDSIYTAFAKEALETKQNVMAGLQDSGDQSAKSVLLAREDNLTTELKELKCCSQLLNTVQKNLTKAASLNDGRECKSGTEKIISSLIEEANQLKSVTLSLSEDGSNEKDILEYYITFESTIKIVNDFIDSLQVKFLKDFNKSSQQIASQEQFSSVIAGVDSLKNINNKIQNLCTAALKAIEKLVDKSGSTDEARKMEIINRKDNIINSFKEIVSRCPKTNNFEKKLLSFSGQYKNTKSESDKILFELIENLDKIINGFNSENAAIVDVPKDKDDKNSFYDNIGKQKSEVIAGYKSEFVTGINNLEKVLEIVENEIDDLAKYSLDSFKYFSNAQLKNPYLADSQLIVLNEAAETFFNLGLYKKAKYYWDCILRLKEIDHAAGRNIAIAETMCNQSDAAVLDAWRKHCEDLYTYDIIIGNPCEHSEIREEIHSKLSSVYAPFMTKSKEPKQNSEEEYQLNLQQFVGMYNNPSQYSEFMVHKIAALINKRLELKTPILFLGLSMTDNVASINKAALAMSKFFESFCKVLPAKIRDQFLKLCLVYVEKSKTFCLDNKNAVISKNPYYEEDKKKLQEWIKSVLELKHTLYLFLSGAGELLKDVQYIDSIFITDLINQLPIENDKQMLDDMAYATFAMYRNSNPVELPTVFSNNITQIPLQHFLKKMFDGEKPENLRFLKQLKRIFANNNSYPVRKDADFINFIDYPSKFLPGFVLQSIENKGQGDTKKAVDYLSACSNMYPFITGFARILNSLDPSSGDKYLKLASENALNKKIKFQCDRQLEFSQFNSSLTSFKTSLESGNHLNAYNTFKTIYKDLAGKKTISEKTIEKLKKYGDGELEALSSVSGYYFKDAAQIKSVLQKIFDIDNEQLIKDAAKAAEPADSFLGNYLISLLNSWIKSNPSEIKSHVNEIIKYKELISQSMANEPEEELKVWNSNMCNMMINASIGHLGTIDSEEKVRSAVGALKQLLELDKENFYAMYYIALFNQQLGSAVVKQSGLSNAKSYFKEADEYVKKLKQIDLGDLNGKVTELDNFLGEIRDSL
jgi:hypothetical protein